MEIQHFKWWSRDTVWPEKLKVSDTEICIVDKDDAIHKLVIEGGIRWDGWDTFRPYSVNSFAKAEHYLQDNEYLETNAGLRIPRCNIKNVRLSKINVGEVQPPYTLIGIKDWTIMEWLPVLTIGAFFGSIALAIGFGIYFKVK